MIPPDSSLNIGLPHDRPRLRASTPSSTSTSPSISTTSSSSSLSLPQLPSSPSSPSHGIQSIRRQVIRHLSTLNSGMNLADDSNGNASRRRSRKSATPPPQLPQAVHNNRPTKPKTTNKHKPHPTPSKPQSKIPQSTTQTHPTQNPKPIDWEIPRKTLHSSIGFLTLYLYATHRPARPVTLLLWAALALIVPADILRLRSPRFERAYERCLGFLMRESEKRTTNGVIWYILGVNFALSVYPLDIAVVSILILSWADTAASTVGRLLGAHTPRLPARVPLLRLPLAPRKSAAGFAAAAAVGAGVAVGFWGWVGPACARAGAAGLSWRGGGGWAGLGAVGAVAGLVAGVAEALDLGALDDNLTLPIISGGCLWVFFGVLGALSS